MWNFVATALIFTYQCNYRLRTSGSAAFNLCMVAMGASDAYTEIGIHAWDIAGGALIVQEAGGVTMDPDGIFPS